MLLDVDLVSVSTTAIDLNENVRQNILFYFLTFNEMQVRQNLESQAINQRWKLKKREIIRKKIIKKPMTRVTTHSTASISRWSFSFFFFHCSSNQLHEHRRSCLPFTIRNLCSYYGSQRQVSVQTRGPRRLLWPSRPPLETFLFNLSPQSSSPF